MIAVLATTLILLALAYITVKDPFWVLKLFVRLTWYAVLLSISPILLIVWFIVKK